VTASAQDPLAPGTDAITIARAVSAREVSAEEVVRATVDRLAAHDHLNAVITLCGAEAISRARTRARETGGRLAGVPLVIKDLIDTAGIRTTYASRIHADHVPDRTAPAVAALEAEGAIVVAKANADEFAWGVAGQNPHYGDVTNPHRPGRIAGGSSGGNGAILAAGLAPLALGTDTGGSVRMPAGACGVVGLKPAVGAVSVEGVFPLVPSFDTVGPMARTVADCALAHEVLTGEPAPAPGLDGLRVGVLAGPPDVTGAAPPQRDPRAGQVAALLRELGADVTEVELPVPEADTWPVFHAEAAASHAATFPSRADEYGRTIRAKLAGAQDVDPGVLAGARAALAAWRAAAARLPDVDVLASPTLGVGELPRAGADELEVRLEFSRYTRAFSYLGWPAIAIGELHLAARDARTLLAAALAVEAGGHRATAPLTAGPQGVEEVLA
jgi:aspartyl-tRNA(Asn)/glutamyl-tRNA(Gln) amidotransferase subunit A